MLADSQAGHNSLTQEIQVGLVILAESFQDRSCPLKESGAGAVRQTRDPEEALGSLKALCASAEAHHQGEVRHVLVNGNAARVHEKGRIKFKASLPQAVLHLLELSTAEPVTEKSQLQGGSSSTSLLDSHREHVLECHDQDCFRCRYLRNMEAWKLKLPWLVDRLWHSNGSTQWGLGCQICMSCGMKGRPTSVFGNWVPVHKFQFQCFWEVLLASLCPGLD